MHSSVWHVDIEFMRLVENTLPVIAAAFAAMLLVAVFLTYRELRRSASAEASGIKYIGGEAQTFNIDGERDDI